MLKFNYLKYCDIIISLNLSLKLCIWKLVCNNSCFLIFKIFLKMNLRLLCIWDVFVFVKFFVFFVVILIESFGFVGFLFLVYDIVWIESYVLFSIECVFDFC